MVKMKQSLNALQIFNEVEELSYQKLSGFSNSSSNNNNNNNNNLQKISRKFHINLTELQSSSIRLIKKCILINKSLEVKKTP